MVIAEQSPSGDDGEESTNTHKTRQRGEALLLISRPNLALSGDGAGQRRRALAHYQTLQVQYNTIVVQDNYHTGTINTIVVV